MEKIDLQLFGGRGADSGLAGGVSTSGRKVSRFYDLTDKYKGYSVHEFENAIRDKPTEHIGVFDKDGKLLVAGTSGNKGSVAVPTSHEEFKNAYTITHNHPYQGGRVIGGSLSGADVQNHLSFGLKGDTRAVSNGPNENTYIFRARQGVKQNATRMAQIAHDADTRYSQIYAKNIKKVTEKLAKQGKTLGDKSEQVGIGAMKRVWKNAKVERYGYEYVEVNKARW